jgi:hypothetical protein
VLVPSDKFASYCPCVQQLLSVVELTFDQFPGAHTAPIYSNRICGRIYNMRRCPHGAGGCISMNFAAAPAR